MSFLYTTRIFTDFLLIRAALTNNRLETMSYSASENNRHALRLNTSYTTREAQRLTNIYRAHKSCVGPALVEYFNLQYSSAN